MNTGKVVQNFVPLYEMLSGRSEGSTFLHLDIRDAESFGHAKGIYVHEPQGEYPSWLGLAYSQYMIDEHGVTDGAERPYPTAHNGEWFIPYPKIKLTHSDTEAQFNLALGPQWWARCKAVLLDGVMAELTVQMIRRPGKQVQEISCHRDSPA